jgi:hypothetical protein
MTLQPCDIILFINDKNDLLSRFSRWAIGPYSHVAMYLGKFFNVPLVYESRGRGVVVASLLGQTGNPVAVMRSVLPPTSLEVKGSTVLAGCLEMRLTAFSIAADEKSFYDYTAIVRFCVPYILKRKFPWLPYNPPKYKRDKFMICSEAVAEVFWRNDIEIVPKNVVPLPGDFAISPFLRYVGQGKLMEDINV